MWNMFLCFRHDTININLKDKPDWFLERNPLGLVPTLETTAGEVIYESPITCDYLDEVYPQKKLLPSSPYAKAQQKMMLEHFSKVLYVKTIFLYICLLLPWVKIILMLLFYTDNALLLQDPHGQKEWRGCLRTDSWTEGEVCQIKWGGLRGQGLWFLYIHQTCKLVDCEVKSVPRNMSATVQYNCNCLWIIINCFFI